MPVDIRATVSCSLGTVISGSISDEYVQGTGLIKCSGSVVISGIITPAVGTAVTFSYTKSGVTRSIPRKLRVLSSFADPFRRTTSVELGCKLTYLSDKRDSIDWTAFDDDENTLTEDDAKIITIPIRAQAVAKKCMDELGITGAFTLTNQFSIAEFDLSPGYVQVLSDLLVSESLCGYLDANEALQVFSLDQAGGTGPVLDAAQLVDIAKIGSGQLPGEAVVVSYSSLKLKRDVSQSATDTGTDAAPGWDSNTATSIYRAPVSYKSPSSGQQQFAVFNVLETTTTTNSYVTITSPDGQQQQKVARRVTEFSTAAPAVIGNVYTEYLNNGIPVQSVPIGKVTTEVYDYDANGIEIFYERQERGGIGFLVGAASVPIAFSSTDYYQLSVNAFVDLGRETRRTLVSGSTSQVTTTTYGHWFRTLSGQQAIANGRVSLTNANQVSDYINALLDIGLTIVDTRTDITPTQAGTSAPTRAQINASRNAKGGNPNNGYRTESKADLQLALGSATAQRRIELSLPYAPDDTFRKVGSVYSSIESDAPQKAQKYGICQNRLLLGNRAGMNLQAAPEVLPAAPFAPFLVRSGSTSALYRTNGTSWTFDAQGLVVSTDALFWGGVGGNAGESWFPIAPGITTLPTTPSTTTVNIVDASGNVVGSYEQMVVGNTVPVYQETRLAQSTLRVRPVVTLLPYALQDTATVPIATKVRAVVTQLTIINVPVAAMTLAGVAPTVSTGARVLVPAASVELAAATPVVSSGASVSVPVATLTLEGIAPDLVGRQKTIVNVPAAELTVAGLLPLVASGASVAVPVADVAVAGLVPAVATTVNPIPALSPVLWFDAADETTVTVASSEITQITDKGSRGWTLSKSTSGPAYSTGINGRKCIDWGSAGHSNFLRNTSTTSTTIAEVYIVLDASFGSTFPTFNGIVSSTSGASWYVAGNSGSSGFSSVTELNRAFINASTTSVFSSGVLPSINSPCILRLGRASGTFNTTTGFQLGNDRTNASRGWSGLIGEVVVFSTALSSTDRTNVLNWLASKWGITI